MAAEREECLYYGQAAGAVLLAKERSGDMNVDEGII